MTTIFTGSKMRSVVWLVGTWSLGALAHVLLHEVRGVREDGVRREHWASFKSRE